jgi:predicted nuclease of restriction endonuclease-like (RecB) superfamily
MSDLVPGSGSVDAGPDYGGMHGDIVALLQAARHAAARSVNSLMTASYWEIGRRIVELEQAGQERASYGQALLKRLSVDLTQRFGRGFSERNLEQMRLFYLAWPPERISQTPSAKSAPTLISQTVSGESSVPAVPEAPIRTSATLSTLAQAFPLPWSAYVRLLSVKSEAARAFYETEALRCGWSVRQLDRQVNSQFYERIALSRNKAAMLQRAEATEPGDAITPEQALKDPFVLEFLNLKDEYSESDLEEALIQHLADFLLELGDDFAFVGRQRRLRLDDSWFRVDLLFFHRGLKCLLVIDLKIGKFTHADAGQMHMYLNYALEHWTKPGENPPVGLVLCTSKGHTEAHYALEGLPNKVMAAEYQTVLPDAKLLEAEIDKTRRELEARRVGRGDVDDAGR